MNRDERQPDWENLLRLVQDDVMRRLRVSGPSYIESVNPNGTVNVQMTLREPMLMQDGTTQLVEVPLVTDVQLIFPRLGGFAITMPPAINDELLIIFSDRCIDAWWQSGGVQNQIDIRFHDLSDGFGLPGISSAPRALANVSTTSAQLRTEDGTAYIELTGTKAVNIMAPGGFSVTAPNSTVTGNVATTGTLTNNEVDVGSDHVHVSGAEGSDGGPPKKGP